MGLRERIYRLVGINESIKASLPVKPEEQIAYVLDENERLMREIDPSGEIPSEIEGAIFDNKTVIENLERILPNSS